MRPFGILVFITLFGYYAPFLEGEEKEGENYCTEEIFLEKCEDIERLGEDWEINTGVEAECKDVNGEYVNPIVDGKIRSWAYGYFSYITEVVEEAMGPGGQPIRRFERYAPVQLLYGEKSWGWPGTTYPAGSLDDLVFCDSGGSRESPRALDTLFLKEKGQPIFLENQGGADGLIWSLDLPGIDFFDSFDSTSYRKGGVGGKEPSLIDQQGNPVYYDIRVSRIFYEEVLEKKLNTRCGFVEFAMDPKRRLEAGAALLKTAWRVVYEGLEEYYFTKEAYVYREDKGSGGCYQKRTVALVGMNFAAEVMGLAPGFLWGAFEHEGNMPYCRDKPSPDIAPVWAFSDGTDCSGDASSKCNQIPKPAPKTSDKPEPKISDQQKPTLACRVHPWGDKDSDEQYFNERCLKSLNDVLIKKRRAEGEAGVWERYLGTGVLWTVENKPVGALHLGNSVIETYAQQHSCVKCHTTRAGPLEKACFKGCGDLPIIEDSYLYQAKIFRLACRK